MQGSDEIGYIKTVSDVFKGLTEKDLIDIYSIVKTRKIDPGEVFIREGDKDQTVYVILTGCVKIEKNIDGRPMEIAVLKKNSCVGEIAFAKDVSRTATAIATEPTTIMFLDKLVFNAIPPQIKSVLVRNLGELADWRVDDLDAKVTDLSMRSNNLDSYMEGLRVGNSGLHEQISDENRNVQYVSDIFKGMSELVLSGIYTQKAMVNLLVRKGIITKKEIIDEINKLRQETHDKTN